MAVYIFSKEVDSLKAIIDRFEGKYAICESEDGNMFNLHRSKLPAHAAEGDVILIDENKVTIDANASKERRAYIEKLMDDVWE